MRDRAFPLGHGNGDLAILSHKSRDVGGNAVVTVSGDLTPGLAREPAIFKINSISPSTLLETASQFLDSI